MAFLCLIRWSSSSLIVFLMFAVSGSLQQQNACRSSSVGTCVCDLADGSGTIDLTSEIRKTASNPYHAANPGYQYDYVFCGVLKDSKLTRCNNKVAVCEYTADYSYTGDLGRPDTMRFELRTYKDKHKTPSVALVSDSDIHEDSTKRRSIAFLNCGSSSQVSYESYGYESTDSDGYLLYIMEFTGSPFCATGGSGGLSGGSILLIIFFSLVTVYFVGGFLVLTFYFKRQGIERIPNVTFWMGLPRLAKEGFLYSWNSAKQLCNRQ